MILSEQLEDNYQAYADLVRRYAETEASSHYRIFSTEFMRQEKLAWILKIQERVLRLRERILSEMGRIIMIEQSRTVKARNTYFQEVKDPEIVQGS